MHKLILVRHGSYDSKTSHLTVRGREEVERFAGLVAPFVSGTVSLLCSETKRAFESAEILGGIFNAKPLQKKGLWSHPDDYPDCLGARRLIRDHEADTVIVVTHGEYVMDFPEFFAESEGWNQKIERREVEIGCGLVIDDQAQTVTYLG